MVAPKKTFSLQFTVCDSFKCLNNLFQCTVFLYFEKLVAAIPSLMDTVFILEQHLQPWIVYIQCIWQIFLFKAYCNFKVELAVIHPCRHTTSFKRLTTSYDVLPTLKERLVSMEIWVAPLLFQEPTWQWSNIFKVLPLFEISTWNRLCFQIYWFDSPPVAAIHSSNGLFLL